MKTLMCPNCGNGISLLINLENIYGKIKVKLLSTKIKVECAGLYAKNPSIENLGLFCTSCKKDVKENDAKIRCELSGKADKINKFWLVKPIKGERRLRRLLIHESRFEEFQADAQRNDLEFTKTRVKIEVAKKEQKDAT